MSRAATKPPIDWTETLNEAALWHDFGDFIQWFHVQAPGLPDPDQQEYVEFQDNLSFMRSQAACLYFGLEADVEAINAKLKTVALTINAERCAGTRLPALLDMADGESILRQLFGGLLVQFAGYAADTLVSGCCNLYRCQGLYRDQQGMPFSAMDVQLKSLERRYRSEIALLQDNDLVDDAGIQRCFDFFIGRPKARFCSDTCRFNTFQITKQFNDPDYLAEKQRRYRKKLRT